MLPSAYSWLSIEPGPKMLLEALKLFGTVEAPGTKDNPVILAWAKELGIKDYVHDSIAWCALFVNLCAHRAGWPMSLRPLWALDFADWGTKADAPKLGDVLVFKRTGGGHVTLYVGEDATAYHCLGGNQSDQVNITRIAKSRLFAARHPIWQIAEPPNRRVVKLAAAGALSKNEA